jgi:hypothetical protein
MSDIRLKCVYFQKGCAGGPVFSTGKFYEVEDYDHDGDFIISDDSKCKMVVCQFDLTLAYYNKGTIAKFEVYEEKPVNNIESNQKLTPDNLEFGQVIHVDGEPYVFLHTTSGGRLVVANYDAAIRTYYKSAFDEFQICPQEQRKQQFLSLWQSQGIDFAYDSMQDEITWSVENLFNFIEQHRERIVEIFEEGK